MTEVTISCIKIYQQSWVWEDPDDLLSYCSVVFDGHVIELQKHWNSWGSRCFGVSLNNFWVSDIGWLNEILQEKSWNKYWGTPA